MSKEVSLVQIQKTSHARSWRALSFFFLLSLVIATSLMFGNSNSEAKQEASKSLGTNVRVKAIANNSVRNPVSTHGPACVSRIIILIDRSHSVVNSANGGMQHANAIKNAVSFNIDALGAQSETHGSRTYVLMYAFASETVLQNPDYAAPSGNNTVNQANFLNWVASTNIATPANRESIKKYVIGSNDNRGIYFRNSSNKPDFLNDPDGNGYTTLANKQKGYPVTDGGSTNYESAFMTAAKQIEFWTGSNPNLRGDDDFDLVLMVTDGVPTSNDGPGGRGYGPTGGFTDPDNQDLSRAQASINNLRLGGFVRPPVPVYGIIAGESADRSDVDSIMSQTFGNGNYQKQRDWAGLSSTVSNAISKFSCIPPAPQKLVKPKIEVEITGTSSTSIKEGESGWIEGRVKNVSEVQDNAGQVALYDVRLSIGGVDSPQFTINPSIVLGAIGESKPFRYEFNIPLGSPTPENKVIIARAKAFYNDSLFDVAPGFNSSPSSAPVTIPFNILRIPLPS